ncbi:MAG: lytic transglycosylase domain-containing protein [Pseudomonadota bacterium]
MSASEAASRTAIARAAQATGVNFDYLLAQAKLESGLDPDARAATSSATGLYQFLGGTWLDTLKKHGAEHGLGWAGQAASDPARRAEVLALRRDPHVSALMAAELANDNKAMLMGATGRDPDPAELYLAHFLGAEGAVRFLSAHAADPGQSAAAILPEAAAANRPVFFGADGSAHSIGAVMGLIRRKVGAAMDDGRAAAWPEAAVTPAGHSPGGPLAQAFHDTNGAAAGSRAGSASMADTLKQAFGLGGGGEAGVPAHVRTAYGRLAALGL